MWCREACHEPGCVGRDSHKASHPCHDYECSKRLPGGEGDPRSVATKGGGGSIVKEGDARSYEAVYTASALRLRLEKAFIAGWNVGFDTLCKIPIKYKWKPKALRQMAEDDWNEYLERTDEEGN